MNVSISPVLVLPLTITNIIITFYGCEFLRKWDILYLSQDALA